MRKLAWRPGDGGCTLPFLPPQPETRLSFRSSGGASNRHHEGIRNRTHACAESTMHQCCDGGEVPAEPARSGVAGHVFMVRAFACRPAVAWKRPPKGQAVRKWSSSLDQANS